MLSLKRNCLLGRLSHTFPDMCTKTLEVYRVEKGKQEDCFPVRHLTRNTSRESWIFC